MTIRLLFALYLTLIFAEVSAHENHTGYAAEKANLAVSVTMDAQQKLWRASVKSGYIVVSHSGDLGKTFSQGVKVNQSPMQIAALGEARPHMVAAKNGHIYLTWTESLKERFAGYIWFSRSIDGGKTFEPPFIVHQDRAKITHRFAALNVSDSGLITVSWVDARDLLAAKKAGNPYSGAAIYYAVSKDQGKTFLAEQKLADSSCECCRIASTNKPDGTPVLLWRHVFDGNQRDHMMAEIPNTAAPAVLHRATYGRWQVNGCPHHGPAITRGGEGEQWWGYHIAYFDGKAKKPGLYYTRMDGVAWATVPKKQFGDYAKKAGHPVIASFQDGDREKVWLAWREIDGKSNQIIAKFSDDGGRTWQTEETIAQTNGQSDYPQFVRHYDQVYLVWNTKASGLIVRAMAI